MLSYVLTTMLKTSKDISNEIRISINKCNGPGRANKREGPDWFRVPML